MQSGLGPTTERICSIAVKTILGLCGILALVRFLIGPPVVTVINATPHTLTKLKALGHGFSKTVPDLEPSERYHFIAIPDGESGIDLEFAANGATRLATGGGYFESGGGHCVVVTVDKTLNVTVSTSGPLCLSWRRIVYPSDRSLLSKSFDTSE